MGFYRRWIWKCFTLHDWQFSNVGSFNKSTHWNLFIEYDRMLCYGSMDQISAHWIYTRSKQTPSSHRILRRTQYIFNFQHGKHCPCSIWSISMGGIEHTDQFNRLLWTVAVGHQKIKNVQENPESFNAPDCGHFHLANLGGIGVEIRFQFREILSGRKRRR